VNPADSPIMILSLTSSSLGKGQIYDAASTVMAQSLSRIRGVGQVVVGGGALPAVRVELNPSMLSKYGIGLEQVRAAIAATNANTPKGQVSAGNQRWEIGANDQLLKAIDYSPLIVAYRNGAPVRIRDVGAAEDSIEDIRTAGYVNGEPAVMLIIFRQPGANIITTVDAVREVLPRVQAAIPPAIDVDVVIDQTTTIRASVHDIERALIISLVLVVLVVFAFLRSPRTAMIPSVAVPLSLIGTFGVMYLLGYGIDNLSLMALTISTGFVVDDAIVVIENITRYREQGKGPLEAALEGAKEIGFTVMSMSLSLVAVFIPILLMSGIVGRLFREFAVTMAAAIVISMVVSLTATPMM
jgi:multidrug efflux pump